MNKDQLDGLLALKLVAEKKNFSAAAAELEVSPPAISQMIKQLEGRLGVALLSRTTRSTSLTEAGERFLATAGPALEQILASIEDVRMYATKPSGLLRLNMPRSIYASFMAPLIASYMKKYPDVAVELFLEDGASDIVGRGFDAGIRLSDILAKDMTALKLYGPVRFVIAASPKYIAKHGRPKTPKDLLSHNCLRLRFENGNMYDRWEFEHKGADVHVQIKGSMIFNDSLMLKSAGIEGAGIIYTSEDSITDQVASGKLEILLPSYVASSTGFYLYYPQRAQVQPKLRAFIDHVKNEIARR